MAVPGVVRDDEMSGSTLSINSNFSSLRVQRQLSGATEKLVSAHTKLASGKRINSAADDSAGLAVALTLKASSRVYTQALRNLNDGISYLATGEGALRQLRDITTRQIELAEQSANGVFNLAQRSALDAEANALVNEYNRIIATTEFNGRIILATPGAALQLQGGYGEEGTVAISVGNDLSRIVGDGTFDSSTTWYSTEYLSSAGQLIDVDGNGTLDMLTMGDLDGDGTEARLTIRLGNGNGSFRAQNQIRTVQGYPGRFALSDLDRDGILDLVTTGGDGISGYLTTWRGSGDGTFSVASSHNISSQTTRGVCLGDTNGDGKTDLVIAENTNVTVRLGCGDGTFQVAANSYAMESGGSEALSLTDIDGNGVLDIVTAGARAV